MKTKYVIKKKSYKKRSPKTRKVRIVRTPRNNFFSTKKTFQLGVIGPQSSSILNNAGNWAFKLSTIAELVTVAGTFDQYRICAVKLRFIPQQNYSQNTTSSGLGILYQTSDYNDATVPASVLELLNRPGVKITRLDKPFTKFIKPRIADAVWSSSGAGTFSGYQVAKPSQWLNASNLNVEHYGWKWYADNLTAQTNVTVFCTMYVQFKDPK